jgi:hypothetical protein
MLATNLSLTYMTLHCPSLFSKGFPTSRGFRVSSSLRFTISSKISLASSSPKLDKNERLANVSSQPLRSVLRYVIRGFRDACSTVKPFDSKSYSRCVPIQRVPTDNFFAGTRTCLYSFSVGKYQGSSGAGSMPLSFKTW